MYKSVEDRNAYSRMWIAERKRKWFEGKVCVKCGAKEHLQLDHINPKLKWSHRIWSYSWARILEETAKCQVLCYGCHVKKTIKDYGNTAHQTEYDHRGCCCWNCASVDHETLDGWLKKRGKTGHQKGQRAAKSLVLTEK